MPDRRKVIVGWMSHWTYANQTPTQDEGWRGVMTMPRVLSLNNGALMQRPPEEFLKRRGELLYGAALVFPSVSWQTIQFIGEGARIEHGKFYPLG